MENILIAGGSSGIGHGIVNYLLSRGYRVSVMDRNEPPADIQGRIDGFFKFDLTTIRQALSLHDRIPASTHFDHIVVTAGGTFPGEVAAIKEGKPFWEVPDEAQEATVNLNLLFQILFVKRILPYLTAESSNKSITLTSSVNSVGRYGLISYSAAKSGLEGFVRAAAEDLGKIGVRINCVLPGSVRTPASVKENMNFEVATKQSLLSRINEPEDIAEVVELLIRSKAVTGQGYVCDSGQSLKSLGGRY